VVPVILEVLTVVITKTRSTSFYDVRPCSLVES
jgi:hypothetical protein